MEGSQLPSYEAALLSETNGKKLRPPSRPYEWATQEVNPPASEAIRCLQTLANVLTAAFCEMVSQNHQPEPPS